MSSLETRSARQRRKQALDAIPPVERTTADGSVRLVRAFRGVTLEQAVGYLEHLGGERTGRAEVRGDGWRARLTTRTVPVGPSYRLTEVTVTWTGEEAAVDAVSTGFRLKAFRAPG